MTVQVAIIGAGHIGGNIARRLAAAGHRITVSFSRDPETLRGLAAEIGGRVEEPAAAVTDAEVVLVSVPWTVIPVALERAGPLKGKIVIDTTNRFDRGPEPDRERPLPRSTPGGWPALSTRSRSTR